MWDLSSPTRNQTHVPCIARWILNQWNTREAPSIIVLHACMLSHFSQVGLFETPWTVACQAPLSMGFFRQEHWSGLLCPPPGDLPTPGIEPLCLMFPALARGFFTTSATWEAHNSFKSHTTQYICFTGFGEHRQSFIFTSKI